MRSSVSVDQASRVGLGREGSVAKDLHTTLVSAEFCELSNPPKTVSIDLGKRQCVAPRRSAISKSAALGVSQDLSERVKMC